MPPRNGLGHITLPATIESRNYIPVTGFDSDRPPITARQARYLHANKLDEDVTNAIQEQLERQAQLIELVHTLAIEELPTPDGICLDIEGSDRLPLDFDGLENRQSSNYPIEVLNVREVDGSLRATIYVPNRRMETFRGKIQKYGDENRDQAGTKGLTISVDSIEAIKMADLDSFWMDDTPMPINSQQVHVWEVWVRKGQAEKLRDISEQYGIQVSSHSLNFQECEICLVTTSLDKLALIQLIATPLVGFGHKEQAPGFFVELSPHEQIDWIDNLAERLEPANDDAPAVCLLDTGVRNTHSLLANSLHDDHCDSYDPTWGVDDHHGHGTQMAGLALLGDLTPHLASSGPVVISHHLESVKILPPIGNNSEEMFGVITEECSNRAWVNAPNRKRVFCLAVTSSGKSINGKPSSWSSTIDKISMGVEGDQNINDDTKQLFCISVGNIPDPLTHGDYPARNDLEQVENPAQSWNGLGVGAVTFKSFSEDPDLDGWSILAQPGQISPTSRTSVSWTEKEWPIKPEIVFEGGNRISDGTFVSDDVDLCLLTTGHNTPLKYSRDTSAATAEAARIAAIIHAEYPSYWPETVRGLMVHSASWSDGMLNGTPVRRMRADEKETLLRRYGWGTPNLDIARFSSSNRACLISQHTIQPFNRSEDHSYAGYNELNIHQLPWPAEYLSEFSDVRVKLKVTLSYFIEPNPSKRIPSQKYSYASHGLRFALQRPLEPDDEFRKRINKRDRTPNVAYQPIDSDNWQLGVNTRNKGCVLSDVWEGTAAQLRLLNGIAILPEGGWWKYRKHLERYNSRCRYSLIMTAQCENDDIDIHAAIKAKIRTLTRIPT